MMHWHARCLAGQQAGRQARCSRTSRCDYKRGELEWCICTEGLGQVLCVSGTSVWEVGGGGRVHVRGTGWAGEGLQPQRRAAAAGAGASGWTHPCCCSASRCPDPAKLVKHLSQSPRPETQSPRRRSGLPRSRGALHDVSPECVLGAGRGVGRGLMNVPKA